MHVAVTAGHARRWSHCMTPQYVDSIVQTLQTVLNATLLQSEGQRLEIRYVVAVVQQLLIVNIEKTLKT